MKPTVIMILKGGSKGTDGSGFATYDVTILACPTEAIQGRGGCYELELKQVGCNAVMRGGTHAPTLDYITTYVDRKGAFYIH